MDPESVVSPAGSFIPLNEQEQRYYSALHVLCQADTPGKLAASKVAELFKAAQLPPETLHKVTELCGAKRLGYFGTPQFYVSLKLLAAAQSGLPVCLESVTANLPLPIFFELKNEAELRYSTIPPSVDTQGIQSGSASGSVSRTPADRCSFKHLEANTDKKISLQEPWSPTQSPSSSPPRSPLAYHSYPHTKQRNSLDSQTAYENIHSSRPAAQLDKHSSPGKYATKLTVENQAVHQAPLVERLNQQGTTDYGDDEPWRITEEQREYYTNQFKTLQPDLEALILGAVAKDFFTKSKLPIPELSHIWELSDVDRDGALTFSEFCTAFHLIVARKNGYPLPESLPPTLHPGFLQHEEVIPDAPERMEPLIVFEETQRKPNHMLRPSFATVTQELKEESSKPDFFVTASTGSSVRKMGSSKEKSLQLGVFSQRPEPPHDLDPQMRTKTRPRSYSSTSIEDAMKKAEEPPTPPPRPQKSHSRASSLDLNKLFQQGTAPVAAQVHGLTMINPSGIKSGWLLPPPALPPRPSTSQVQVSHFVSEKSPQNKVHQANFADFSHFREEEESVVKVEDQEPHSRFGQSTEDLTNLSKQDTTGESHGLVPQKPVRKKYLPESQNLETAPPSAIQFPLSGKASQKLLSRQKREIQMAIRKNRETNAVLTRLNSELQQQLKVIHQERVTLEAQLELQRPLAST